MGSFFGGSRRTAVAVLAIVLLLGVVVGCGSDDGGDSAQGGDVTLTIGGWGGASNEGTQSAYLDPFDAEQGVAARFEDAPGTQLARVEAQNQAGEIEWDALNSVAGDAAFTLDERGHLAKLPADLRADLEQELGAERVTPFGFAHGNIANVIVCNMDRMDTCPKDMGEFYDTDKFPQDRMFAGIAPIMAVTTAEVAAGVPPSETADKPVDVDGAFQELERLKPAIDVFWQSGDQQEQILRSGAADMGIMWSNRAHRLIADGMNLKIVWSGGAYEPSYWTVLEGAPHSDEAFDLLRWIADHPRAQADWAEVVGASVPNPEAFDFLPPSLVENLADRGENFKQLAVPNFEWYAQNTEELDQRYQDFVRGG